MITLKRYFLSETEREKYETLLLEKMKISKEYVFQYDDEELLNFIKELDKQEKRVTS
ncbi:hypothetical protein [Bacillus kexueae]|uniref:hypothetical protein n=1 Tax=Aeribacillus kexueae TaxID=2078952 RepID=UPI001FAED8EB|nr:hypothetical protein [Bacillus kexueae]